MPEVRFTKEDIVDAAFSVTRKHGWERCTARMIARELGSSTMPIYSGLSCMQKLKDAIARRASDLLIRYQTKERSRWRFLDMGIGYVLFAQIEKNLFRMLYSKESGEDEPGDETGGRHGYVVEAVMERLRDESVLPGFTLEEKKDILYKMWIFSHGLAVLSNNGVIAEMTEEEVTKLLMETGKTVIAGKKAEKIRTEP